MTDRRDPSRDELFENLRIELRSGVLIVATLAQLRDEQYGYTLRKALAAVRMDIDESTLYPLLRRLASHGLLTRHGSPAVVAERYGAPRRSVAFGWQLIGPELFALYFRILLLDWTITFIVVPIIWWFGTAIPRLGFWSFAGPMLTQLVVVTLV